MTLIGGKYWMLINKMTIMLNVYTQGRRRAKYYFYKSFVELYPFGLMNKTVLEQLNT